MTAATATLAPGPANGPGTGETADDAAITWADFLAATHQYTATGGCTHPIRLHGRIGAIDLGTGELAPLYDSGTQPGGVLLTACGNRRETICPACSAVYKHDARQLVRAGLIGGKNVPESVAEHPCVFATLTAPSFGPVHARRMCGKPCCPAAPAATHTPAAARTAATSPAPVGTTPTIRGSAAPCYDYDSAVLFNAHAAELWRRFATYLPRHLARLAGLTPAQLRRQVAIRYVKVAEYQARGVVHFHAIIRLDAPSETWQPPSPAFTAEILCEAIGQAATAAVITTEPVRSQPPVTLRFGTQTDARAVRHGGELPGTGHALSVQAVANYIAKYATKALDAPGIPDRPIRSALDLDGLRCNRHYTRMITTAWRLGGKLTPGRTRLCKWAHMLGYGGHFLTKSRRYSTTFGQLRRARTEHRKRQRHPGGEHDPWGRPLDERLVLILHTWTYVGTGYPTTPGAELALASAARARAHRQNIPAA